MRQSLVAGNWKMNGNREDSSALLDGILAGIGDIKAEVAVCPPAILIPLAVEKLSGSSVKVGGQNLDYHASGAYTGEISGPMLKNAGCEYVIIGHSERREYYGEDDDLVARKFEAAQEHGLTPILCVGESLEEREGGTTETVVERQLDAVLEHHGIEAFKNAVIAYEPVWAIGTGKTATPEQAQEVHKFIRDKLAGLDATVAEGCRLLYGGSMKPDNAAELISQPDIDGGLIGGASLSAGDFLGICAAAS
ncbi:MAG: triosephosphate isomerase [Acidithiobacillales bacterium SG8_45]|jgi:triosephosphate isomerase|nr:MAG: triosephosphate isomerase [Acidithiobacillales bacterium SG8_45]